MWWPQTAGDGIGLAAPQVAGCVGCVHGDGCGVIVSRPSQTILGSSEDGVVFCDFIT